MKRIFSAVFILLFVSAISAAEFRNAEVEQLISANKMPEGIVFELIEFEDDTWLWATPMLKSLSQQLHKKYPGLDIALVSHGSEIFDLALNSANRESKEIGQLALLADEGLEVHVCGSYASYKHLGENDFQSFVDVAPSAPAQLNDYIKLGFVPILLQKSDAVH